MSTFTVVALHVIVKHMKTCRTPMHWLSAARLQAVGGTLPASSLPIGIPRSSGAAGSSQMALSLPLEGGLEEPPVGGSLPAGAFGMSPTESARQGHPPQPTACPKVVSPNLAQRPKCCMSMIPETNACEDLTRVPRKCCEACALVADTWDTHQEVAGTGC